MKPTLTQSNITSAYHSGLLRDYVIFAKSSFAALHSTGARGVKLTTSELLVCSGREVYNLIPRTTDSVNTGLQGTEAMMWSI